MVQQSKQTFLLLLCGCSLFYEVQSGIFIVYPFQMGIMNPSKPKFSSRKFDSDDIDYHKMVNETSLHLVYPVKEELLIMTPTPVEDTDATTEIPATFSYESDEFMANFMTTDITNGTTEPPDSDALRFDLDSSTEVTSPDATTITTEISVPKTTSTDSAVHLPSIYDTAGPLKFLKKRMFRDRKYPNRYISNLITSSTKRPLILTPEKRSKTNSIASFSKYVTEGPAVDKSYVSYKRHTFKPKKLKKKGVKGSTTLNIK